jgi:hypothetical protein
MTPQEQQQFLELGREVLKRQPFSVLVVPSSTHCARGTAC